jgi:hypothetical protein
VQHLPRRGLQLNCRDRDDAHERRDKHRKQLELQRGYAQLRLSRVPRLADLVSSQRSSTDSERFQLFKGLLTQALFLCAEHTQHCNECHGNCKKGSAVTTIQNAIDR